MGPGTTKSRSATAAVLAATAGILMGACGKVADVEDAGGMDAGNVDADGALLDEAPLDAPTVLDASSQSDTRAPPITDAAMDRDDGAPPLECKVTSATTLPGVSIVFRAPIRCDFTLNEARRGISIPYDVVISSEVTDVVGLPQDAGNCGQPDASGLIPPFERLGDGGQSYCQCDVGFCLGQPRSPQTLRVGSYAYAFAWDGVNWGGPSDTGQPKGLSFPSGSYVLMLSTSGTRGGVRFSVDATLIVRLHL